MKSRRKYAVREKTGQSIEAAIPLLIHTISQSNRHAPGDYVYEAGNLAARKAVLTRLMRARNLAASLANLPGWLADGFSDIVLLEEKKFLA